MDKVPSLLSDVSTRLASTSDTPSLDASVLLAHILRKPRTWILAHPDLHLTKEGQKHLTEALARLENGEPLPYILGHWEFFGMEFDISPDVLIPRPETELLVEKAISWLSGSPARRIVADIGTGSGVIAISIAVHCPDVAILATEISPAALDIARRNASKFNVADRIEFILCDILPAQPQLESKEQGLLDLICANLPYIPTDTLHSLPVYGNEPALALDGGPDGLDLLRKLLKLAPDWLAPNGLILLEVESTLGSQALNLANEKFPQAKIRLHQDLAGRDRLLEVAL